MTERPPMPAGRPCEFTQEIADTICERLIAGESLRGICADEGLPSATTVFRWLAREDMASFREQYSHAREAQADVLFDDILEISDDARNDWMTRRGDNGEEDAGWAANGEHIQRSRLRVDARKWMAGKLAPKKYGDRVQNVHTGEDGGPVQVNITGDDKGLL